MRRSIVAPMVATLLVGLTSTISATGSIGSYNCSSSSSCFSASQSGPSGASGVAIRGIATNASGLRGASTTASGVLGQTAAGSIMSAGIEGESTKSNGSDLAGGFGLPALTGGTAPAYGVVAAGMLIGSYGATTNLGSTTNAGVGVGGIETNINRNGTDYNIGVIGRGYNGTGVVALTGVESQPMPALPYGSVALIASDFNVGGVGEAVVNANDGLYLENGTANLIADTAGKFAVNYDGSESIAGTLNAPDLNVAIANQYIHANVDSGSILNATYTASNGNTSGFDFSSNGNLDITGTLTTSSGTYARTRGESGRERVAYDSRSTSPAIEDVGEAQLAGGSAFVRLDAALADVIDRRSNYFVFITPEGDSNQLYVTQKTPTGFVVREAHGGRSTVAFQYRLVAKPFDDDSRRLAVAPLRKSYSAAKPSGPNLAAIAARYRSTRGVGSARLLSLDPFKRLRERLGPAKFAAALAEFNRQHR